jgi:NADPH:quinone reductase-like Zn-dependent oxidoreductase
MRALVASPTTADGIEIRTVPDAAATRADQALVSVNAISVDGGEARRLAAAADGWRPGWDVAGVVAAAAADGSGPSVGSPCRRLRQPRVGRRRWMERDRLCTPSALAAIDDTVTVRQAATLPVAGLTALRTAGNWRANASDHGSGRRCRSVRDPARRAWRRVTGYRRATGTGRSAGAARRGGCDRRDRETPTACTT